MPSNDNKGQEKSKSENQLCHNVAPCKISVHSIISNENHSLADHKDLAFLLNFGIIKVRSLMLNPNTNKKGLYHVKK